MQSDVTFEFLSRLPSGELTRVDPLVLNLAVARGAPTLSSLAIQDYSAKADRWTAEFEHYLPSSESQFRRSPHEWKNDLAFFRLGLLCWYVDEILGIRYREDQQFLQAVWYTDPSDLFLNGVMDSRRGTCGNMSALHVAIGWRLGWPVSLACAGWHILCRYSDGIKTHNIEATNNGRGGFHSHPDSYYRAKYRISEEAIRDGSDLTALSSRSMLGLFVGLRARHWHDIGHFQEAAADYRLASHLFPASRLFRRKAGENTWR
jgi:hypothetical protein